MMMPMIYDISNDMADMITHRTHLMSTDHIGLVILQSARTKAKRYTVAGFRTHTREVSS
jgi:hypothetical protein